MGAKGLNVVGLATRVLGPVLLAALVFASAPGIAAGAAHAQFAPREKMSIGFSPATPQGTTNITSNTEAGYVIVSTAGTVSDLKATWNVPQIAAKCPKAQHISSVLIGIDGFNGGTWVEIGTRTDCTNGTASYFAWYAIYPAYTTLISMTISPADTMHAEVKFSSTTNKFTVLIHDAKTGKSFSTSKAVSKAKREYAEWWVSNTDQGSTFPMTDFGWVVFNNASTTISGGTASLGTFSNYKVTEWNQANTAKVAIPLALVNSGGTFRVNWKSAGP